MPTEADARIVVDRLLRQAGWDIEDKSQVSTEEAAADGRADYLLRNLRQHRQGNLAQSLRAIPYPSHFRFKGEDVEARPYQLGCLRASDDALI